jgi:hypothetical protein
MFGIKGLAAGAHNFVVTYGTVGEVSASVQHFFGVDQTTPLGDTATAAVVGTSNAISITNATGDWTVSAIAANTDNTIRPVSPMVMTGWALSGAQSGRCHAVGYKSTAGTSVTWTAANDYHPLIAVVLKRTQ